LIKIRSLAFQTIPLIQEDRATDIVKVVQSRISKYRLILITKYAIPWYINKIVPCEAILISMLPVNDTYYESRCECEDKL
jgi:hypothetical protein